MGKKLEITVTFENGDNGHQEDMEFIVENQAALNTTDDQLKSLVNAPSLESFLEFYRNTLNKDGALYGILFPLIKRWGHDNLGWGDVMISNPRIKYNDKYVELQLTDDESYEFDEKTKIQLVKDETEPYMYFID